MCFNAASALVRWISILALWRQPTCGVLHRNYGLLLPAARAVS